MKSFAVEVKSFLYRFLGGLLHMSKKALQGGDELPTEALLMVLRSVPMGSELTPDKPKSGGMEQGLRTG